MVNKRTAAATTATVAVDKTEQTLEAVLSSLGLEVAKQKIQQELEVHVTNWVALILQSNAPEHAEIRTELIRNVKAILAARTLQECVIGAIADSKTASNLE